MSYRGDINLGDTIDIKFCTVTTTGAPTQLAVTPVVSAYPDNSTTQLTAGITLTVDFDAITGLNNVRVVATGVNGYATATNYDLVITTGTVGGTSVVGYVIGSFSIEKRSALRPATAGRTLVIDAAGLADANTVKVGPTGTGTAQTAGDLATMITAVDDLVDTEVAAIKTKTDFLPSVTAGAAGGLMIAGSNAATTFATLTVTGASIFTGNVSYAAGITITQSTVNGHGISITGNGIGHGVKFIGGDTGSGAHFVGGATSGHAVNTEAASGYSGFNGVGVGGGYGFRGSMEFLPAALIGGRINADATAISGDSVAADRLETMLDGTGGNTLSAAITGNITGNLSGSVGSVTGAVGSVTGDVGGNVTGSVGSIASNGINNNSLHPNACSKITDSGIQRGASNWENNSDDRSLGWAISKLVNKIDLNAAGDTLTIRKSNDSTALFTQSVTTSGGAAPVVSLDTA